MLVVSHDRYFLDRECDQIWELDNQAITIYEGNYTEYRAEKKKIEREAEATLRKPALSEAASKKGRVEVSQAQLDRDADKEAARKAKELARRQKELEEKIAELEAKKKELEDQFLDPALMQRADKMRALSEQLGKVKDELETTFDKWQELETRKQA